MRMDRLRTWLGRPEDGSLRIELAYDGVAGLEPIADWTRKDLDADVDDVAGSIIEQMQDNANTQEGQRKYVPFALRWLGEGGAPLKTARHRVRPKAPEDGEDAKDELDVVSVGSSRAQADYQVWIKELMRALLAKDQAINDAYRTVLQANKDTIAMLSAQAERAFKVVENQRSERMEDRPPAEITTEQREESRIRIQAWEKLIELMPEASSLALNAIAAKILPPVPADADAPTNGHAKAS